MDKKKKEIMKKKGDKFQGFNPDKKVTEEIYLRRLAKIIKNG